MACPKCGDTGVYEDEDGVIRLCDCPAGQRPKKKPKK